VEFVSRYVSHTPDAQGMVNYSLEEHEVWQILYKRQKKIIRNRACKEFLQGLKDLKISANRIPQLPEISKTLMKLTGWQVKPVAALISARNFFELLANRCFPAATFIRFKDEIDYVQEPDIFHEIFGHCPMLTNPVFADFVCGYAKRVLELPEEHWPLLQRLFWFTVEFGLIKTKKGIRAYGGGILSSIGETAYSLESNIPMRVIFDPLVALRTPYRIDQLQVVYFVIDSYETLYNLMQVDILNLMSKAKELGEFPALFKIDLNNPNIHILAC
jgi:phenylalanine-4-hydroxylase